jgi:hypothetical protein
VVGDRVEVLEAAQRHAEALTGHDDDGDVGLRLTA